MDNAEPPGGVQRAARGLEQRVQEQTVLASLRILYPANRTPRRSGVDARRSIRSISDSCLSGRHSRGRSGPWLLFRHSSLVTLARHECDSGL